MKIKRINKIVFIGFAICTLYGFASSQSNAEIQRELAGHLKNIGKWSVYRGTGDSGRLEKENEALTKKLLRYGKLAGTLKYDFPALKKLMFLSTSEDKRFRIYSWDSEEGGTMHSFHSVYQYLGQNGRAFAKTFESDDGDAGGFVTDIFTLATKDGPVYLARFSSVLSTADAYQSIDLFRVRGNTLDTKVKLIRTKEGLTHTLGFEYDFFSVVDRSDRPIKLILYDVSTKTIKIPVVIADDKNPLGRVTKRYILYRFNGTYFVKVA